MEPYRSPKRTEEKALGFLRQYNVMYPEQICAFFAGEEKSVERSLKRLEKKRQIYKNPYTGLIASSEFAYSLKDEGTIKSLWVLIDMRKKQKVEGHYLAGKEDFPARIVFFGGQDIYDILYVGSGDMKLVMGMYAKSRRMGENHIIALEDKSLIEQIDIPGVIGFCVVKEGGNIEYYRKKK